MAVVTVRRRVAPPPDCHVRNFRDAAKISILTSMPSALCRLTLGEVQTPGSSSTPHDQVAMLSVHVGSCSYRYLHAVHGNAGPVSCAVVNNELHGGGWATGSLCAAQVHLVLQSLVESTEARLSNLVRTLTKRFSQVSATQECSPRSITSAVD